ncbi:MAG TPA: hypothetical protein VKI64_11765 [Acidimicrobiales bacterium]|nr:hypothetical protein [Acidimicrobiales bacterium]
MGMLGTPQGAVDDVAVIKDAPAQGGPVVVPSQLPPVIRLANPHSPAAVAR